jgi:Pyrimidine reductase, riboflavin biosynthesis
MTVDGKLTTRNHSGVDFTSRADKARLIEQRAWSDAVLVGHSTLEQDNVRLGIPSQSLRAERVARGQPPYPLRVLVSNRGRINPDLNIFHSHFSPILIFSTVRMPQDVRRELRKKAILHLSQSKVDLRSVLEQLRRDYGVKRLACEGGGALFRSLLELDLVDQLNLTVAPFLFGGRKAPTLTGTDSSFLKHSIRCTLKEMKIVGGECFLTYKIKGKQKV